MAIFRYLLSNLEKEKQGFWCEYISPHGRLSIFNTQGRFSPKSTRFWRRNLELRIGYKREVQQASKDISQLGGVANWDANRVRGGVPRYPATPVTHSPLSGVSTPSSLTGRKKFHLSFLCYIYV